MKRAWLVLALVLLAMRPALAWHETGHMLVARIAMDHLEPATKTQLERLMKIQENPLCGVPCDERNDAFITGSCFMDDIRKQNKSFAAWHFIDYPYNPDGTAMKQPADVNVVSAIDKVLAVLKQSDASEAQRAEAVRFLTHLVGDIHQPLHCVQLFTREFPEGDKGGNKFVLDSADRNLHAFWDEGGDGLPDVKRPLSKEGADEITDMARDIEREFRSDTLAELREHRLPEQWAIESFDMAREIAYTIKPGQAPPEAYVARAQHACRRRIALAGYRLARLLNETLGKS